MSLISPTATLISAGKPSLSSSTSDPNPAPLVTQNFVTPLLERQDGPIIQICQAGEIEGNMHDDDEGDDAMICDQAMEGIDRKSSANGHANNPFFGDYPNHELGVGVWAGQGNHILGHKPVQVKLDAVRPVGFLDVCFCCRRRLRHERDIFIYRGDTAFCSEECRHRQILSDERRSAARANSEKTSRTAVAA